MREMSHALLLVAAALLHAPAAAGQAAPPTFEVVLQVGPRERAPEGVATEPEFEYESPRRGHLFLEVAAEGFVPTLHVSTEEGRLLSDVRHDRYGHRSIDTVGLAGPEALEIRVACASDVPGGRAVLRGFFFPESEETKAALADLQRRWGPRLQEVGALEEGAGTVDALRRELRSIPSGDESVGAAYFFLGLAHRALGEGHPGTAAELFGEALAIFGHRLPADSQMVLDTRMFRARSLRRAGELGEALRAIDSAIEHRKETVSACASAMRNDRWERARNLHGLGRLEEAASELELLLPCADDPLAADSHTYWRMRQHLAEIHRDLNRRDRALAIQEGVPAALGTLLGPDHPVVLDAWLELSALHFKLSQYERSLEIDGDVVERVQAADPVDEELLAWALLSRGSDLGALGRPVEAIADLERALAYRRQLPDTPPSEVVDVLSQLGTNLGRIGDGERARAVLTEALAIAETYLGEGDLELGLVQHNLGFALLITGDFGPARAQFERSLPAIERAEGPDADLTLDARYNLAHSLTRLGLAAEAEEVYRQILERLDAARPARSDDVAAASLGLAVALSHQGRDGEALQLEREALAVRRALYGDGSRPVRAALANTLLSAALVGSEAEQRALARELNENAQRALEAAVLALPPRELEPFALELGATVLSPLLSVGRGLGSPQERDELREDVAASVEGLRSIALRSARVRRSFSSDRSLQGLLAKLVERNREYVEAISSRSTLAEINAALGLREQAYVELLEAARERRLPEAAPPLLEGAGSAWRSDLKPGECAVGFWVYGQFPGTGVEGHTARAATPTLLAFVYRADGTVEDVVLGSVEEIEAAAFRWREAVQWGVERGVEDARRIRAAGESLRSLVWERLPLGEARTVYAALDGPLHGVALASLPGPTGGLLGDEIDLRVVPSLRAIRDPRPRRSGPRSVLAVGDVLYASRSGEDAAGVRSPGGAAKERPRFGPLPETAGEVRSIEEILGERPGTRVEVWVAAEPTVEAVLQRVPAFDHLHFATHGYFGPELLIGGRPWRAPSTAAAGRAPTPFEELAARLSPRLVAGLALAGAGGDPAGAGGLQGILSAEDIAGLDLSDCELVVLSACDSAAGVGRAGLVERPLKRGQALAGARHVLASLWRVDSERTAEFMTRFYTTLGAEDTTPREALRETRRWMRERRQYTRDWAAWVLSGPAE